MGTEVAGGLKIKVKRGIDLTNRDITNSSCDPYVVIQAGDVKVKTRAVKSNYNPVWDEDLFLSISDLDLPIRLSVIDHDMLSRDDPMGEAKIDIKAYVEYYMGWVGEAPVSGTTVKKVGPSDANCLAEESEMVWTSYGKMVQHMTLMLNNVESGKVEIQIEWFDRL